jgi:hypothetical protein
MCQRGVKSFEGSTTRTQQRVWRLCNNCSLGHDWSGPAMRNWLLTTEPSYTEPGAMPLDAAKLPDIDMSDDPQFL